MSQATAKNQTPDGRTVEVFAADHPHAIRIHPTRLLDWGARELTGA
jgi:hypothetical protein